MTPPTVISPVVYCVPQHRSFAESLKEDVLPTVLPDAEQHSASDQLVRPRQRSWLWQWLWLCACVYCPTLTVRHVDPRGSACHQGPSIRA